MSNYIFSVGFRGVLAAWIARKTSMMNLGGAWVLDDLDIVTGEGIPSIFDLLMPDATPADGQKSDADLLAEIERLAPHLVRPMRLVTLAPRQPSLFGRLTGKRRDTRERIDLGSHQAGRPLTLGSLEGVIERCVFVDTVRLTIALTRDYAARGGVFFREEAPSAGFNLTDDNQDPDRFASRVGFVMRRRYREEFAYLLFCEDRIPFIALPLDQDMVLVERAVGPATPDEAMEHLSLAYHAMFGLEPDKDDIVTSFYREDGEDCSTIQDLREDDRFLTGLINAVSGPVGGSNPDVAGLIDGRIDENYGQFANKLAANYSHLDAAYLRGLVARHGPLAPEVLGEVHRDSDLGEDFGGGLREHEARWMLREEFARDAQDIAFRRGPFGLRGADLERLQDWVERQMDRDGAVR